MIHAQCFSSRPSFGCQKPSKGPVTITQCCVLEQVAGARLRTGIIEKLTEDVAAVIFEFKAYAESIRPYIECQELKRQIKTLRQELSKTNEMSRGLQNLSGIVYKLHHVDLKEAKIRCAESWAVRVPGMTFPNYITCTDFVVFWLLCFPTGWYRISGTARHASLQLLYSVSGMA